MAKTVRLTQEERNAAAKAALKKAALELIALKGYHEASLAEIGLRAGYSRSLVKYHFGSKTQLVRELLEDFFHNDLYAEMFQIPPGSTGEQAFQRLFDHLDTAWEHYCTQFSQSGEKLAGRGEIILCLNMMFSQDPEMVDCMREMSETMHRGVQDILEFCIEKNCIRRDINTRATAAFYLHSVWSMATSLFSEIDDADSDIGGMGDSIRLFLNALRV